LTFAIEFVLSHFLKKYRMVFYESILLSVSTSIQRVKKQENTKKKNAPNVDQPPYTEVFNVIDVATTEAKKE